jgi:hypothetical protein
MAKVNAMRINLSNTQASLLLDIQTRNDLDGRGYRLVYDKHKLPQLERLTDLGLLRHGREWEGEPRAPLEGEVAQRVNHASSILLKRPGEFRFALALLVEASKAKARLDAPGFWLTTLGRSVLAEWSRTNDRAGSKGAS